MKILFATDGSEYAAAAARLLGSLKAFQPVDLTILTVTYDPEDPNADSVRPWYADYQEQVAGRVRKHFELIGSHFQEAPNVEFLHRHGDPSHEILEAAESLGSELVVLGARGHTFLETLVLGSVSESVALYSPCSVLILRPRLDDDFKPDVHRIMLCYDGSKRSIAALDRVSAVKWPKETEFELFAASQPVDAYGGDFAVYPASIPALTSHTEKMAEDCRQAYASKLPNLEVHTMSAHHIGDAISARAEETGTDLIMLGDSSHSPLTKLLLGSTSKYVLRHAPCSVWISRERDDSNAA